MQLIASPKTSWQPQESYPQVANTANISSTAVVVGSVEIAENAMIAPGVILRGDEGGKIFIGNKSYLLDMVVVHGIKQRSVKIDIRDHSVYISAKVFCSPSSIIHGPVYIGENSFIGIRSLICASTIGNNCYIGHGAKLIEVTIPDGKYVPHNMVVDSAQKVEDLPNAPNKTTLLLDRFRYS